MVGQEVGRWLRRLREEREMSLTQVGLRSGGAVNPSTLSKIENGHRRAGPEILVSLAKVYRREPEELLRRAGYLPETREIAEPEAVYATVETMSAIERAIRQDPDLDAEQKRGLVLSARLLVAPHIAEAKRRKTRRSDRQVG